MATGEVPYLREELVSHRRYVLMTGILEILLAITSVPNTHAPISSARIHDDIIRGAILVKGTKLMLPIRLYACCIRCRGPSSSRMDEKSGENEWKSKAILDSASDSEMETHLYR